MIIQSQTKTENKLDHGLWYMMKDLRLNILVLNISHFLNMNQNSVDYKSLCWRSFDWLDVIEPRRLMEMLMQQILINLLVLFNQNSFKKVQYTGRQSQIKKRLYQHKEAVDKLNSIPKLWKAKAYTITFEGKSLFVGIDKMAGSRRHYQGKSEKRASFFKLKSSDVSDLPKTYTLERCLDALRQYKQCGSCYAISTMEMLSARLKMKVEKVILSPQYSVDCNYHNQGCDGGYPFLVEKLAFEQYLVTEEQYPYKGDAGIWKKIDFSQSSKVYGAKNYKYHVGIVQGWFCYQEFEPGQDFMNYQSGIYHSEKVDHSVLCYGWGEENGVKFCLLQNSWGEQGNFIINRMKRGAQESAIERMAQAADPVIYSKSSGEFIEISQSNLRKQ
ncbi:unnamed protein product (macronuclear) [Paramecium tetraurelia]|uniref:Peptidase C1A papain C-terminal domain-containing protein n=1 Tax=Paramecium tetraurelia TaxID=5888 RepID=A0DTZ2_PARTE|nr:uncharacterized protein GSPATT00020193001 [Paramecium tetraurelia]CAK86509.1 unnamed protein product [Paramecium tetraurelia]|eukprot:XP_001453906.1 hypothetical protein (macronuclear) [Paramecium tetraurelia strain d4-2]